MTLRSELQEKKLHAMLGDIARQKQHFGRRLTVDEWKALFVDAAGLRGVSVLPSLDGSHFVVWWPSTTRLTTVELAKLIDLVLTWAPLNGVRLASEIW